MNKKRELYRRIRDSGLTVITFEDIFDLAKMRSSGDKLCPSKRALHRLVERLRHDGLLARTDVYGIYIPVTEFVDA